MYESFYTNLLIFYMAKEHDLLLRIIGKKKETERERERNSQTRRNYKENKTILDEMTTNRNTQCIKPFGCIH